MGRGNVVSVLLLLVAVHLSKQDLEVITSGLSSCTPPFVNISDGCFYFKIPPFGVIGETYSWLEAEAECKFLGAKMAYILNQEEQDALTKYMIQLIEELSLPECAWWIGFTKNTTENVWIWKDTDIEANFTAWSFGGPLEVSGANCAWMNSMCNTGEWSNYYCDWKMWNIVCRK